MIPKLPPPSAVFRLGAVMLLLGGCAMEQDLGNGTPSVWSPPTGQLVTNSDDDGTGSGFRPPTCPIEGEDGPTACTCTRPIEDSKCSNAVATACTYDDGHTICVCNAAGRWSCLEGVYTRSLKFVPVDGEVCVPGVEVVRPCDGAGANDACKLTCTCVFGAYRCNP